MSTMIPKKVDTVNRKGKTAPAPEASVLDLIHTVMHGVRSLQYQWPDEPTLAGLTPMEGKVLGFFARHPGATQRDLAQHSGRDKAQLARLIKSLRERGLLLAEEDGSDRRQVCLRLSDAGQAVRDTLQQRERVLEQQALAGLSPAQRQQLGELLRSVQANLAPLAGDDPTST
jgi:DNA-binding MarR family transcriptional regulator